MANFELFVVADKAGAALKRDGCNGWSVSVCSLWRSLLSKMNESGFNVIEIKIIF